MITLRRDPDLAARQRGARLAVRRQRRSRSVLYPRRAGRGLPESSVAAGRPRPALRRTLPCDPPRPDNAERSLAATRRDAARDARHGGAAGPDDGTIVAIFQAATGAVTVSRTYHAARQDLRRLDTTIRQDLAGVTCKMTPPNNPQDNLGYFEYGENALADPQGEDSDDYLRFTAKAPEGRPFTGRIWVPQVAVDRVTRRATRHGRPGRHAGAGPGHQPVRGDHLLPPRRQPLSPRPA